MARARRRAGWGLTGVWTSCSKKRAPGGQQRGHSASRRCWSCRGARASCRGGDGAVCIYPEEVTLEGELRCDGRDEDCDGEVDEGCPSCEPSPEVCDGVDNDCDFVIDEGCDDGVISG